MALTSSPSTLSSTLTFRARPKRELLLLLLQLLLLLLALLHTHALAGCHVGLLDMFLWCVVAGTCTALGGRVVTGT